ncbi:MAG TPA: isoprenylcysteine carboxylmethyltransferase family protein [Candidatus Acidoferrales bacterium]|nr:isoprenylcysteine carboxylmethyltransferase family protein [Candidatus Acidoferrales bacterium]
MNNSWAAVWPVPWTLVSIQIAWAATFLYFVVSALLTNRIKKRETVSGQVLDRILLLGGYLLLFSGLPMHGIPNQHFLQPRASLQIAGAALTYLGLPLTIWSRACLGRYWSVVVALKQDHRLIQSGPYSMIRHPLYSGIILAAIGMTLCVTTWSSLLGAGLLLVCFERRALKEDAFLAGEFGAEFEVYRQHTGRLLPRLG